MPPPVPPSVNDGRMIAGRPMSSSASSACDQRLDLMRARRLEPDLPHRVAEQLAVFGLVDGVRGRADHLDVVLLEHAHLLSDSAQLSAVCPPMVGSSAKPPGRTCRSFSMILATISGRDRLDIGRVGQVRVGHDGRRIGVDQHDPVALCLQRLAGLRSRIIELAGLADHDRAGADDQDRWRCRSAWASFSAVVPRRPDGPPPKSMAKVLSLGPGSRRRRAPERQQPARHKKGAQTARLTKGAEVGPAHGAL